VCRRRRPDWDDKRISTVIRTLESPIGFRLPQATAAHTRSYLSSNKEDPTKKQKVFDGFVVLDKRAKILAAFDAEVDEAVRADLDSLLHELNYFGRSESWVISHLSSLEGLGDLNCLPAQAQKDRGGMESVRVACLRPYIDYEQLPTRPVLGKGRNKRELSWLDAVSLSTDELLRDGWSDPPAQLMMDFLLRRNALRPPPRRHRRPLESRFQVATYALHSTVLPWVTETVPLAERIRVFLMGIHKRVSGGDPEAVSPLFSGKAPDGRPALGHKHMFILPLDKDDDGRLDHLLIKVATPFEASELDALDNLRSVWQPNGKPDLKLVLESLSMDLPYPPTRRWASATPFVTKRHHRKGRGPFHEWLAGEVLRECRNHGLPRPVSIHFISHSLSRSHPLRWMEFIRSRKGKSPMRGYGCVLEFNEDVRGPFALGALCHFGLGLFLPEPGETASSVIRSGGYASKE
jgi:CRISPR-associated protein Csb2